MERQQSQNVSVDTLSTQSVVTEYVEVVNQAISKNSGSWAMGKMIELGDSAIGDRKFGVAIFRDDSGSPHDFYTMKFEDGRLRIVAHGKEDPVFTWKASESYLRDVVAERDKFIESPAKLDFEWLKDRTGLN